MDWTNGLKVQIVKKDSIGKCNEKEKKYRLTLKLFAKVEIMNKDEYFVVETGKYAGGKIVTQGIHDAGVRHEKGHKDSYECLASKNMFKTEYEFVIDSVCEKAFQCNRRKLINGASDALAKLLLDESNKDIMRKYNDDIWQRMCGWYHETFTRADGPGGTDSMGKKLPKVLKCPAKETLFEKTYDTAGCEVYKQ